MALDFETVDVFTTSAFGGNPLAVVFGAEGLATDRLQAIAREFNFSETTFVLPPLEPTHTAQVRIFTPGSELPFAGHPNVGTAVVVARRGELFGRPVGERVVFDEGVGPVALETIRDAEVITGAVLTAPAMPTVEGVADAGDTAAALGLEPADLRSDRHPPTILSVGPRFLVAEVASLDALARAQSDAGLIRRHLGADAPGEAYVYVRTDQAPGRMAVQSRMFAPALGITEDPATGAAAVVLAGLLSTLTPGDLAITIDQGIEMGRPSRIDAQVAGAEGAKSITITGRCIAMMRGRIHT